MIKYYTGESLPDSLSLSCLGLKVYSTFLAYGTKYDFSKFWIQTVEESNEQTAVICKFYGELMIAAKPSADTEELEQFVNVIGYSSLVSDIQIKSAIESGFIMKLKPNDTCTAFITMDHYVIEEQVNIKGFYEFLYGNFRENITTCYEEWLVDWSHRVRHKTATYALLALGEEYVASAAALAISEKSVLLGAISTKENCRGKHYAHTLIHYFAEKYKNSTIFVMCNPAKEGLYLKAGFENSGSFYVV